MDGDEVVTAGALRDALGRLDYDTPVSEELLGEVMREASVRTSADPPRRYACTACGVEDRNHRFAACDGGEWVEI